MGTSASREPPPSSPFPEPTQSPQPVSSIPPRPWRISPSLDSENLSMLKTRVENYILPSHLNVTRARILMLGPVGAGKSSFFNTIKSIFQGRIVHQAIAGSDHKSVTKKYRTYKTRTLTSDRTLNFLLCDTCGIEPSERPDVVDINYLLEGNVPDGYTFSGEPIRPNIRGFISQPELQDKVHCVAFVFDACTVKTATKVTWDKLFQLKSRMNDMDIPVVILLTKIDKLEQTLVDDVSKVFFSEDVRKAMEFVSEQLKVPSGNVMPIKNYENEMNCQDDISCLALQALDRMLGYAKDFLENQNDLNGADVEERE